MRAVTYRKVDVDGIRVFYREAGPKDAPTILLLHGFPTSSHMFRDLIPQLADRFHVIAPDLPGFAAWRVTVLPQLKVDRLCSVVDGTADCDPISDLGRARKALSRQPENLIDRPRSRSPACLAGKALRSFSMTPP